MALGFCHLWKGPDLVQGLVEKLQRPDAQFSDQIKIAAERVNIGDRIDPPQRGLGCPAVIGFQPDQGKGTDLMIFFRLPQLNREPVDHLLVQQLVDAVLHRSSGDSERFGEIGHRSPRIACQKM